MMQGHFKLLWQRMSSRRCGAAAALLAPALFAGGCQQPSLPPADAPGRLAYLTEFDRIDSAKSGRITLDQSTQYYATTFARLDLNHDGRLTVEELSGYMPAMNSTSAADLLQRLDRDGDGSLAPHEFAVLQNWLFALASSNDAMTRKDAETNFPALVVEKRGKDPADTPPTAHRN